MSIKPIPNLTIPSKKDPLIIIKKQINNIYIQFNEMHPRGQHIKFVSLNHPRQQKYQQNTYNKITQLQLQLQQTLTHIDVLKQTNKSLSQKIASYERRFQDMKILQQELQFRRDQQKHIQQHLDNYQQINCKLRDKICKLEIQLKNKDNSGSKCCSCRLSYRNTSNQQLGINVGLQNSKISTGRPNKSSLEKQNHPITPKSRVNINLDKFNIQEIDSIHQIQARRRVFL